MRFAGTCAQFAVVDTHALRGWISAIDFAEWPQQHRLADRKMRPAMVSDVRWHGFGAAVEGVTAASLAELRKVYPRVTESFNPLLSVVMPGHEIAAHRDAQPPDWVGRVHVPLFTNDRALMRIDGRAHHMVVGYAYLVDTTREHSVENFGDAPRVHYMFDVRFG